MAGATAGATRGLESEFNDALDDLGFEDNEEVEAH